VSVSTGDSDKNIVLDERGSNAPSMGPSTLSTGSVSPTYINYI
jgi:hypothetical protein